mgnify:CR=1 FL=1
MNIIEITVPDIGNYHDVDVIEVLVQPGQQISKDSALLTLPHMNAAIVQAMVCDCAVV